MRRFQPIYIGRRSFGAAPSAAEVAVPERAFSLRAKAEAAAVVGLRYPEPFIEALGGRKVALVHSHFAVDGTYALPLARKLGVPLVTTLHGFDVTRSRRAMLASLRPAWLNGVLFERSLQRHADLFLCVSDFIRAAALARGFPEEKLLVHHMGIDVSRLSMREGIGEDGLIVHVGRLVQKKGTRHLLGAVAAARSQVPNIRLVILGDGPLRAGLEAQARSLGIADAVQFLGVQPNGIALDWIRRAACLAVPSVAAADGDREGLGMVNLEASAQGVPILSSDSGGIVDAVEHGVTGLMHREGDVAAMAADIVTVLSDPDLRLRLGHGGRAKMLRAFDIAKQTAKLEDIYADLIARRKAE